MAISFALGFSPKWYLADNSGKPLAGGYLVCLSSLDQTTINPVYQDIGGTLPWPLNNVPNGGGQPFRQGILFDANGEQGPLYFQFNSAASEILYYLEAYDSNGNLQWTMDDYLPPELFGGGGGGNVTTSIDVENLVINNVMYRDNIGTSPIAAPVQKLVAPGANAGLSNNVANSSGLYTGPDIYFIKNNTNATDTISMPVFGAGSSQTFNPDTTPLNYFNYTCTLQGTGETSKFIQFPINSGAFNLSNQSVTLSLWARCNANSNQLILSWFQFFGDGSGASSSSPVPIQTLNLTNQWKRYIISSQTIPSVIAASLGSCGNDGLFLQLNYPLNALTNIDITKPSIYLGNITPTQDYHTYDMFDGWMNTPRTGDVKTCFNLLTQSIPGWVPMNDGTIGSANSTTTIRSNRDTFPLYNLLWNNISSPTSNAWCAVSGGLGTSAVSDFNANKVMQLPLALGRVLSGSGTPTGISSPIAKTFGSSDGEQAHTLTINEMPAHNHPGSTYNLQTGQAAAQPSSICGVGQSPTTYQISVQVASQGGGASHNIIQPTTYANYFIKL